VELTNTMEKSPAWEANRFLGRYRTVELTNTMEKSPAWEANRVLGRYRTVKLTNTMEKSPAWKANRFLGSQEISLYGSACGDTCNTSSPVVDGPRYRVQPADMAQ
jgi:hypothetical protein